MKEIKRKYEKVPSRISDKEKEMYEERDRVFRIWKEFRKY
jgi:hypothetical protein